MERSDRDINEFLAGLPADVRDDMQVLHHEISEVMAGHPATLFVGKFWGGSDQEIIGYGTYSYVRSDKTEVEWFIVGLARQKAYISVYLSAVEDGRYVAEAHGADIGKVKVGKSNISFASLDDIDLAKLRALVARARDVASA